MLPQLLARVFFAPINKAWFPSVKIVFRMARPQVKHFLCNESEIVLFHCTILYSNRTASKSNNFKRQKWPGNGAQEHARGGSGDKITPISLTLNLYGMLPVSHWQIRGGGQSSHDPIRSVSGTLIPVGKEFRTG